SRRPHHPPPFPYTTLFRSEPPESIGRRILGLDKRPSLVQFVRCCQIGNLFQIALRGRVLPRNRSRHLDPIEYPFGQQLANGLPRSEEHTSELQSRVDLVCS